MVSERGFDVQYLEGRFNSLIIATNKFIGLEFNINVSLCPFKDYTSYVRSKSVDCGPSKFNSLCLLQPQCRCSIWNRKGISLTERMCETISKEFCQPKVEWMSVKGRPLRLPTTQMRPTPKAWALFIVQTLDFASNQSEFIVKRCQTLVEILNHNPIDVGLLIAKNIKYMAEAPQRACEDFCIIN